MYVWCSRTSWHILSTWSTFANATFMIEGGMRHSGESQKRQFWADTEKEVPGWEAGALQETDMEAGGHSSRKQLPWQGWEVCKVAPRDRSPAWQREGDRAARAGVGLPSPSVKQSRPWPLQCCHSPSQSACQSVVAAGGEEVSIPAYKCCFSSPCLSHIPGHSRS